jgi:hypothetical protein
LYKDTLLTDPLASQETPYQLHTFESANHPFLLVHEHPPVAVKKVFKAHTSLLPLQLNVGGHVVGLADGEDDGALTGAFVGALVFFLVGVCVFSTVGAGVALTGALVTLTGALVTLTGALVALTGALVAADTGAGVAGAPLFFLSLFLSFFFFFFCFNSLPPSMLLTWPEVVENSSDRISVVFDTSMFDYFRLCKISI